MTGRDVDRRQFLVASSVVGGTVLAGCSDAISSDEGDELSPTDDGPTDSPTSTETPVPEPATFQPKKIDRHDLEVVTITDTLERDGEEINVYENTSDRVFATCLQRYVYETGRVNDEQESIWEDNFRLQVGVQPGDSVIGLQAAYNEGYAPPSKPYKPALLTDNEIVQGEEIAEGVRFSFPVDGEVRRLVGWFGEFETAGDGEIIIPYDTLGPRYLERPLHKVRVATVTSEETFYMQLPYPDTSFEVTDIQSTDDGEGIQLTEMTAEVTINSEKPTHLVNLQTDFGYPESYDYGGSIDEDNFVEIETGGTTEITRQFTDPPNSITDSDFRVGFPIERETFTVVLGKIAPLASQTVSRARFIP